MTHSPLITIDTSTILASSLLKVELDEDARAVEVYHYVGDEMDFTRIQCEDLADAHRECRRINTHWADFA